MATMWWITPVSIPPGAESPRCAVLPMRRAAAASLVIMALGAGVFAWVIQDKNYALALLTLQLKRQIDLVEQQRDVAEQALDRATRERERAAAEAERRQITTVLQEELPVIPVVWYLQTAAISRGVEGVSIDPFERSYRLSRMRWAQ